jgi:hypothetical protein
MRHDPRLDPLSDHFTVTDKFMGEFHREGLAHEFDCVGTLKRRFTWKK